AYQSRSVRAFRGRASPHRATGPRFSSAQNCRRSPYPRPRSSHPVRGYWESACASEPSHPPPEPALAFSCVAPIRAPRLRLSRRHSNRARLYLCDAREQTLHPSAGYICPPALEAIHQGDHVQDENHPPIAQNRSSTYQIGRDRPVIERLDNQLAFTFQRVDNDAELAVPAI